MNSSDRPARPTPADEPARLETLGRSSGPASLILSSLADGAKHGYALTKDIESFAGVRLAPGTLYEALSRLEAHGMIEAVESNDRRRPYRLTATGATALSTYLQAQRQVAEVGLRRLAGSWAGTVDSGLASARRATAAGGEAPVRRLLLWYPRGWRDRYGDEFAELLIAEQAEQGPSWRRAANVAATGLRARLAGAGLAGHPLDPAAAARAGLATFASCAAVSGLAGAVMWAQLAIGLQWSAPDDHRITEAMDLMSGALLVLARADRPGRRPGGLGRDSRGRPRRRAPAPLASGAGRRRHADPGRRRPAFRERLAGHRRPPAGAPGPGARRGRRVRLGGHHVDHLLLGAPGDARRVPRGPAGLDGGEPGRDRVRRHRRACDSCAASNCHPERSVITPGLPALPGPDWLPSSAGRCAGSCPAAGQRRCSAPGSSTGPGWPCSRSPPSPGRPRRGGRRSPGWLEPLSR